MILHSSGINAFQRCARKWWFSDRNAGLGFQPKVDSSPLLLGSWIHKAMYRYYNNGLDLDDGFNQAIEKTRQGWANQGVIVQPWMEEKVVGAQKLGKAMIRGYKPWSYDDTGRYADQNLTFLAAEQEFFIEVGTDIITGTWDGLVRQKDGGLWVFETKTTRNIEELVDGLPFDWQPRIYVWAAERIVDEPVLGIIYNIVKKADPYGVKILQNGLPSLDKNELKNTTVKAYLELFAKGALALTHPLPTQQALKYSAAIKDLQRQPNEFYLRYPYRVPRQHLDVLKGQLRVVADQMRLTKKLGKYAPPSWNRFDCPMYCPFNEACSALSDGRDYVTLLNETMNNKERETYFG